MKGVEDYNAVRENLVKGVTARRLLGHPGPPIGRTRFAALKRATGQTGHYVSVSKMRKYLHEHPEFSERQVYPRNIKQSPCSSPRGPQPEVEHKRDEQSRSHD